MFIFCSKTGVKSLLQEEIIHIKVIVFLSLVLPMRRYTEGSVNPSSKGLLPSIGR